jgi:type II secretory pathway predicted ATPase ExeA
MYQSHWGLRRSPFAGRQTPLFYEGESQIEAMARLRFCVAERRSAVLLGARGAGKSLALAEFADPCRRSGREVAVVNLAGISPRELLWRLAGQLSLGPGPDEDAVRLFRRLADYAAGAQWRGTAAVVLLDDADQAGPDVQSTLVRLLECSAGRTPWATTVMSAAPDQATRLSAALVDAIDLRLDLGSWTEPETIGYVQHALLDAGCERPVFEDEAVAVLYVLSEGVPRQVNRLADRALLAAAAAGLDMIDAGVVEAAHDAIAWTVLA